MQLKQLCEFCDEYLNVGEFKDYCPNGLQVEANPEVENIVCGVTASQALIEAAIEQGAIAPIIPSTSRLFGSTTTRPDQASRGAF
jgi:putative NIF3 family GTP cyclohydrolase 1 type 2